MITDVVCDMTVKSFSIKPVYNLSNHKKKKNFNNTPDHKSGSCTARSNIFTEKKTGCCTVDILADNNTLLKLFLLYCAV